MTDAKLVSARSSTQPFPVGRYLFALIVGFAVMGWSILELNHMCPLGFKAFERNFPYFFGAFVVWLTARSRRRWTGFALSVGLVLFFSLVFVPRYMAYVHRPGP